MKMKKLLFLMFAMAASTTAFAHVANVDAHSGYAIEIEMSADESTDQITYVFKGTIGESPVVMNLIDWPDERGWAGKLTYTQSGKKLEIKNGYSHALSLGLEVYDEKGVKVADLMLVGRDFENGKSGYIGSYDGTNGESMPVKLIDETVF